MVSCKLCKVTSGSRSTIGREKITFHRCPQKPELKKLWTDFLYLHLGNSVSVNNFFLCSFHFEEKCFDRTSAQKAGGPITGERGTYTTPRARRESNPRPKV
ncbi:hypothetical protein Zmor_026799 [Zophobas morio]|uniref:THAP-type domain-containing protein n=1 Tax=Zophobas morio TaxID=2755281 RepID=A0AA38HWA9_9CUCU|nr:hypothetical protein Zmor_026799 [Zophobas morio]